VPTVETVVKVRKPSIDIIWSSRGSETVLSITSGAAPCKDMLTVTTGKSTSGIWLTPIREKPTPPKTIKAAINIQANTGLRIETSEILMESDAPPKINLFQ
jgi:hypothetical protein